MAERRMLSKKIIDTDLFMDMPTTAKLLYFYMNLHADDDGFIGNAKTVIRMIGANDDDLLILIAKKFLISFDNGILVIKDWRVHNYIRKDTYHETIYTEQKALLDVDSNGSYTSRGRGVDESLTQVRLGKDRLGKDRVVVAESKTENHDNDIPVETENKKPADENDEPFEDAMSLYRQNASEYMPATAQQLLDWIDDFAKVSGNSNMANNIVSLAMHESMDNGSIKMSYINAILKSWSNQGVTNLEQAKKASQEHKSQYQRGNKRTIPKERNWMDESPSFTDDQLGF